MRPAHLLGACLAGLAMWATIIWIIMNGLIIVTCWVLGAAAVLFWMKRHE